MSYNNNQQSRPGQGSGYQGNKPSGTGGQQSNNRFTPKIPLTDYPTEKAAIEAETTTTQLRKILSAIVLISNKAKVENPTGDKTKAISEVMEREKRKLIVRIVYQGAREAAVKNLEKKLNLINSIKMVKTYGDWAKLHDTFEEVVAFSKYHKE